MINSIEDIQSNKTVISVLEKEKRLIKQVKDGLLIPQIYLFGSFYLCGKPNKIIQDEIRVYVASDTDTVVLYNSLSRHVTLVSLYYGYDVTVKNIRYIGFKSRKIVAFEVITNSVVELTDNLCPYCKSKMYLDLVSDRLYCVYYHAAKYIEKIM